MRYRSNLDIPDGWAIVDINEVTESLQNGLYKPIEFYDDRGIACLRMYNIEDGSIVWKDIKRMVLTSDEVEQYGLLPGDILINRVNSRELVGKAAVIPTGIEPCVYESKNIRLRVNNKIANSKLIGYILNLEGQNFFNRNAQQTVGMASINQEQIRSMPLVLPPLNEQYRIVAKIEALMERSRRAKAALDAIPPLLEQFRQSVLAAAFRGDLTADWRKRHPNISSGSIVLEEIAKERLRRWRTTQPNNKRKLASESVNSSSFAMPSRLENALSFECPHSWTWAQAEEVCGFVTKGTTPAAEKMTEGTGEVPYIKVYNLTNNGSLDFSVNPTFVSKAVHESELNRSRVYPGDVLMNIVGPPLGKVSIVPDDFPEWNINQAIAIFRAMPGIDNHFLCYCLLAKPILDVAVRAAKATAGQSNLTLEICRDLPLPVPPTQEQKEIVRRVEHYFVIANCLERLVKISEAQTQELCKSILSKAFSGELVPQDPNDEPASVLLERIREERRQAEATSGKLGSKRRGRKQNNSTEQLSLPED